mmetsp:Transcript_18480/g.17594  ORF Transcript_18480/g.17594 Transcript_18480/m.17594 type:complete len:167 (-) Transcript_18480:281-781(-)|eukprot:CAMPEP_0170555016 /NCGR_PEP_ID=MMETSP0211-20121228/12887_1 /TAXON_ID=311385 /ORGANISM="Pseudokeronopsis sp., Strain OXSARD2" /LENGTH=166 /DNA_ID=CAMNT_0010864511 /DNA_START=1420 /DNA_END=1920 /DNA_ORIENTATION=+
MTSGLTDYRKREIKKIMGFDMESFQCPLCKALSNVLLPYNEIEFDKKKLQEENMPPETIKKAMDFYMTFFGRIMRNQNSLLVKDVLVPDVMDNFLMIWDVLDFIEHRIQLIDVKGLTDFLKTERTVTGKNDYANFLKCTGDFFAGIYDEMLTKRKEDTIENYGETI